MNFQIVQTSETLYYSAILHDTSLKFALITEKQLLNLGCGFPLAHGQHQ